MTYQTISRTSMRGGLLHIKELGFIPPTIIDVGAALGTFDLYEVFPRSHHVLIEPIAENEPHLAKICHKLAKAQYIIAAATHKTGMATLHVAPELVHSSASVDHITHDSIPKSDNSLMREVQAIALDRLCQDLQLEPPYLVKIDVDGNEVDVLAGAIETLKQTEYVIIEVSLFNQIHQVIQFMTTQGFVIYDILDLVQRPEDGALWQADMAFVKADGRFRQNTTFTSTDQTTAELTKYLNTFRDSCIKHIETYYSDNSAAFLEDLSLSPINFIAFPDWKQPEEVILSELAELLRSIVTHPNSDRITLLIDSTDVEAKTANLAIAGAALYLLSEEGLDITAQEPNVVILGSLHAMQWQMLLPHLTARICLDYENIQAVVLADAQDLNQV